jgi:hypothetical protein
MSQCTLQSVEDFFGLHIWVEIAVGYLGIALYKPFWNAFASQTSFKKCIVYPNVKLYKNIINNYFKFLDSTKYRLSQHTSFTCFFLESRWRIQYRYWTARCRRTKACDTSYAVQKVIMYSSIFWIMKVRFYTRYRLWKSISLWIWKSVCKKCFCVNGVALEQFGQWKWLRRNRGQRGKKTKNSRGWEGG